MARDAEATKERILAAATDEFSAHGFAGGRVERIAAKAQRSALPVSYTHLTLPTTPYV